MSEKPVDFMNPESVADELAAVEANEASAPKEKKERKPRKPKVITITVPEGLKAGDTFEYEIPVGGNGGGRGILAGLSLEEMNDDQLKIEYRNANSVFYKQTKAKGKANEAAAERLEAVKAEMEKRGIQPTSRAGATKVDAATIAELIKSGKISVEDIQALLDGNDAE